MPATAYLLQAALIALWWLAMYASPAVYGAFQFPGIPPVAFNAFLLPDLTVVLVASAVRAYRASLGLSYFILGGFAYAALYCLNATLLTGGGWLPTSVMGLGLAYNGFLIFGAASFRTAGTDNHWVNAGKTFIQIICVWTITLVVLPGVLLEAFGELQVPSGGHLYFAGLLFVAFSGLGLWSAYAMVRWGRGTPLPLDQTQVLVVSGPYRLVRNPMAVAGVGQGLAVALGFGSWAVLVYSLLGAVLWHWVVRPLEEADLLGRFGAGYVAYRGRVGLWWPWSRARSGAGL